ncbi:hypothetical protein F4V57_13905 [Acinetobacter qingfengensis]|uniref:Uncharacterized protein n=1 Tax=Acinetobacter qingfengensis TaxID=1262585 RepID=A0A1E7REL0_9GAMM|nr:hypothetical protein [Acinetobacter qingfengensis]KAA8731172.1 hypothetical protein F4V57_13905 [Acinetobacter qingfengensis]OEY97840.1 hypothetical protein BJI46_08045 [Acinetobacter qingfengensis]
MNKYILVGFILLICWSVAQAGNLDQANQTRLSTEGSSGSTVQAVQWIERPLGYASHPTQVIVVSPNVGVIYQPPSQVHYQKTEEITLPYGGTYRRSIEYLPQQPSGIELRPQPLPPRIIIQQGKYAQH